MVVLRHDRAVTLDEVIAVARGAAVGVERDTVALLAARRAEAVAHVRASGQPAYGFNRGFGHNVDVPVPEDRLEDLQVNLIRSHASGVGEPAPREVVRAAMFLRAVSLARGHSGVGPAVVEGLAAMLSAGVTPLVPRFGSVGASGDLAPLSHIALGLIGEGRAWLGDDPEPLPAAEALARAGLAPVHLGMKEGLALNNGMQFSTAYGVLAVFQARRLLRTAAVATAMSAQVTLSADTPFRADVQALRPHPGAVEAARWLMALMAGSPIREAHRAYEIDGEVQEPYNVRCAAQVLGTCHDLVEEAAATLEIEANSVTDNPVLLPDPATGRHVDIVSGGLFHGMPIAVRLYGVLQALGLMARLSNMRCARFVDARRNKGLGDDLKWPGGDDAVSSGMMIPEYVSAALTNAIWGACMPTHLMSVSTDAGQEDHVSMAATLAVRLWDTLPRLAETLAIELAFATQAAEIRRRSDSFPSKKVLTADQLARLGEHQRRFLDAVAGVLAEREPLHEVSCHLVARHPWRGEERLLSPPCEAVRATVLASFPPVVRDRSLSDDLRRLAERVADGTVLAAAEGVVRL